MSTSLLYPNFAAEEGVRTTLPQEAVFHHLARLWRAITGSSWQTHEVAPAYSQSALNSSAWIEPVFEWIPTQRGMLPWLATTQSEQLAHQMDLPHLGPASTSVRCVHDKAFAILEAEQMDVLPDCIAGLPRVLDSSHFDTRLEAAINEVRATLNRWPEWARNNFTIKPRFGTSGRGRLPGYDGEITEAMCRGLQNMLIRGGAIIEPWLERTRDFSVQLHVTHNGGVQILGVTTQLITTSGVYRGNRGTLSPTGSIGSGSEHDEALINAAQEVASRAAQYGFSGPCGVDAFAFQHPTEGTAQLRPIVELNARFTVGTIALGILTRIAQRETSTQQRHWAFIFNASSKVANQAQSAFGNDVCHLATSEGGPCSLLILTENDAELDTICERAI